MSKLLSALDRASQPAPRRMGFVAADTSAPSAPLTLMARLASDSGVSLGDAGSQVDGVIVSASQAGDASAPGDLSEETPWGVHAATLAQDEMGPLSEKGCDFFVLDAEGAPAALLNEENTAKLLSVKSSIDEAYLRVLEDVPVDCLLIEHDASGPLKITDLMNLRSVLTAVTKPSIVTVRPDLSEGDLAALRHVGVIGVLVDVASDDDAAQLSRLRKEIDALPPREEDDRRQVESLGGRGAAPPPGLNDDSYDE